MSEPTFNVPTEVLFSIIGQKEVERLLLIQRVQQLEAEKNKEKPELKAV